MLQVLIQNQHAFLQGFLTTLKLLGCIMLAGVPLGTLVGVWAGRGSPDILTAVRAARFLTKVVPVIVILFWLHFPLQSILRVVIDPFWTTVFALGLINAISIASIVSAELQLLPKTYREAGLTLGMSSGQVIRYVELPLLLRRTTPQILLVQAAMLEYTLFASLISVQELFRVAQSINSAIYRPVEIYSLIVLFFLIILVPLHLSVSWMQKKYAARYA